MKRRFTLLITAFMLTSTAPAQDWRAELKVLGGIDAVEDLATTSTPGGGFMAGAEGAVNLNPVFAVTGHYVYNDLGSGIRAFCSAPACANVNGTAVYHEFMGGVRVRANADGRVSPYL